MHTAIRSWRRGLARHLAKRSWRSGVGGGEEGEEEGGGGGEGVLIKSSNPHLAGGELAKMWSSYKESFGINTSKDKRKTCLLVNIPCIYKMAMQNPDS